MKDILPPDIISMVKAEGESLGFGSVKLEIILRDGNPRWEITRSRSILEATNAPHIVSKAEKTTIKCRGNK